MLKALPLRGRLFQGRFWKDLAIGASTFSIMATLFWLFSPGRSTLGIHTPIETIIVLFLFGITLGLPCFAMWTLTIKTWFHESTLTNSQLLTDSDAGDHNPNSSRVRVFAGIALFLSIAALQIFLWMNHTAVPVQVPADLPHDSEILSQQPQIAEVIPLEFNSDPKPLNVNDLIGTWVAIAGDRAGRTAGSELVEIVRITIDAPASGVEASDMDTMSSDMWTDPGLPLTITAVGGEVQKGNFSINTSSGKFSLAIVENNRVAQEWFGKIQLLGNRDELQMEFTDANVGGGQRPPEDSSRFGLGGRGAEPVAPRIVASYLFLKK